jgi:hypothetical protein
MQLNPSLPTALEIADEGTNIANTPHIRVNFVGDGVTATDGGGGTATITIPGSVAGDQAVARARRTTAFTILTTFGDVAFDATDIENDTSVVEHDNTNTERVYLKETGPYQVTYHARITPPTASFNGCVEAQILLNGLTPIVGSDDCASIFFDSSIPGDEHEDSVKRTFAWNFTAGDYITLQLKKTELGSTQTIVTEVNVTLEAFRMSGERGATGAAGADGVDGDDGAPGPSGPSNAFKDPCRAATTGSITLSGLQTVDGVSLAVNDRVLVKNQTPAFNNGIYNAKTGAWTRATDYDDNAEVIGGQVLTVSEGTVNGNSLWQLTTDDPITVGTTALVYEEKVGGTGTTVAQLDSFDVNSALFLGSDFAAPGSRNGHPTADFDDTADEQLVWERTVSKDYLNGDIIFDVDTVAKTATTGDMVIGIEVERIAPGGHDIDSDSWATQKVSSAVTTNGTSGVVTRITVTLTNSEADGIQAGDGVRYRLYARPTHGSWTLSGDMQVTKVHVRQ